MVERTVMISEGASAPRESFRGYGVTLRRFSGLAGPLRRRRHVAGGDLYLMEPSRAREGRRCARGFGMRRLGYGTVALTLLAMLLHAIVSTISDHPRAL